MHVPNAVPFVTELVEDGEEDVRAEAAATLKQLEGLAKEEFDVDRDAGDGAAVSRGERRRDAGFQVSPLLAHIYTRVAHWSQLELGSSRDRLAAARTGRISMLRRVHRAA